jgi:hypothetical protein
MIRKGGNRFSEKIVLKQKEGLQGIEWVVLGDHSGGDGCG